MGAITKAIPVNSTESIVRETVYDITRKQEAKAARKVDGPKMGLEKAADVLRVPIQLFFHLFLCVVCNLFCHLFST
jgi:hypothetical protein